MSSFDDGAREWDTPDRVKMAGRIVESLVAKVDFKNVASLLDYGAGTGLIGLQLAEKVSSITFMDTSAGMLDVIMEKLCCLNLKADVLKIDLLEDMSFDKKFDTIVTSMALHHIPDTVAIINRFANLLNAGGTLAIVDLVSEDGSFHGEGFEGHLGFDLCKLVKICSNAKLTVSYADTIQSIKKGDQRYPQFLLVARKPM